MQSLNIEPALLAVLRRQGITTPTPVQKEAVPVIRKGQDVIIKSQTGTGKTLAFLLPLLEKVKTKSDDVQAVILTPTRELTLQIAKVAATLGKAIDVRTLAIYGGGDFERQRERLGKGVHIVVGTPGRVLDHLRRKTLHIDHATRFVLDEADEMLKRGFLEDMETILSQTAEDRQILLFSATMPDKILALTRRYLVQPALIEIKTETVTLTGITQKVVDTTEESKPAKLSELINTDAPYLAMVFCRTKERVKKLAFKLATRGYLVEELHGDLSQMQRKMVLEKFRTAKVQILVTTDIAARGLDIDGITHIYNYDIPDDVESYIHRIGRTGRAGNTGSATTFVNSREYPKLRNIEAGIKQQIQKDLTSRSLEARKKRLAREKAREREKAEQNQKEAQKAKSKYANRKGSTHKGRNPRSRRQRK